jgi:hypothetical protein
VGYLEIVAYDVGVSADPNVTADLAHGIDPSLGEVDFALLLEPLRIPHGDDPRQIARPHLHGGRTGWRTTTTFVRQKVHTCGTVVPVSVPRDDESQAADHFRVGAGQLGDLDQLRGENK